jgi:hypothetical protein
MMVGKDTIDFSKMKISTLHNNKINGLHFKDPIIIRLPIMRCTFGINILANSFRDVNNQNSCHCHLSFDNGNPEIDNFQENMKQLDAFVMKIMSEKYNMRYVDSIIKHDREKYSPTIKCKLPYNHIKNCFKCEFYDEYYSEIKPSSFMNKIDSGNRVEAVIKIQNILGLFGIIPQLVQIRKCPSIIDKIKLDGSKEQLFEEIRIKCINRDFGWKTTIGCISNSDNNNLYIQTPLTKYITKTKTNIQFQIENEHESEMFFSNIDRLKEKIRKTKDGGKYPFVVKDIEYYKRHTHHNYERTEYTITNYDNKTNYKLEIMDKLNFDKIQCNNKRQFILVSCIIQDYMTTQKYCDLVFRIKRVI